MMRRLDDPLSTVLHAAEEAIASPSYCWDNARRPHAPALVVQVTMAGAAFWEDAAGRRLVPPGWAMIFAHGEESRYGYPPEAKEVYRQRFVSFSEGTVGPLLAQLRAEFGPIVRCPIGGGAWAVLDTLLRHYRARDWPDRLAQDELLHALVRALYREQIARTQLDDPVAYARHLFDDHFRSPLNLKEVAARCGISREHLSRAFAARYGTSPATYLRRCRLDYAQTLLRSTHAAVEDIAVASGFAGANAFVRTFRQVVGVSPGRWRGEGAAR